MKSIKKVKFVAVMVFMLFVNNIFSQGNSDGGYINYSVIPKSNFEKNGGSAALNNLEINLITPTIKLAEKTTINNILNYRLSNYVYTDIGAANNILPDNLQEIRYSILFRSQLNENWKLLAIPRISIRGDFETKLNSDYLFPSFTIVAIKTSIKNPNFRWGFGINYNNDLLKNNVLPIITLQYNTKKIIVNAFLPNSATITFLPANKKTEYGFGFTGEGNIYKINNFNLNNENIEYLQTLNIFINPTLSYNFASTFWINLKAGIVLARNYSLYNEQVKSSSPDFDNTLNVSSFAQIGISFRAKK